MSAGGTSKYSLGRGDFGTPPPGYVPGVGRGAKSIEQGVKPTSQPPGARMKRPEPVPSEDTDDKGDYSESNYDQFAGYGGALFNNLPYDEEDREADAAYAHVDEVMDERRKKRREEKAKEEIEKYRQAQPKISQLFAAEKKELAKLSEEDWASLPESTDRKYRPKRSREKYTPLPDSVIAAAWAESQPASSIDPNSGMATPASGMQTPAGMATPVITNLTAISAAREQIISIKLDKIADSVSGRTNVDPVGYMTSIKSLKLRSTGEVQDTEKARRLFQSVVNTNPEHAPGWIALARLEEVAGRMGEARRVIAKGCQECPLNEDVWLENARLQTPENARVALAEAVKHLPRSLKIWMKAADMEPDQKAKSRIYRKALELIPNSVQLWKAAIELEDTEDAIILLGRAVECVPSCVDMWLALARLETHENARRVLNKARAAIPTEPLIWVTAVRLEEQYGAPSEVLERMVSKAMQSLAQHNVVLKREQWLQHAMKAEEAQSIGTAQAIIKLTIGVGVEEAERKETWINDAETCLEAKRIECARAVFAHALSVFPGKKSANSSLETTTAASLWARAAVLEQEHGTPETLDALLRKATTYCPQAETLWLMWAKHKWRTGDLATARAILGEAFRANSNSEQIWLAAVKLEWESNMIDRARSLLSRARERCGTAKVWLKSAILERQQGNYEEAIRLLRAAIEKQPDFPKFHLMLAQLLTDNAKDIAGARQAYAEGTQRCPSFIPLWTSFVVFEERHSSASRARAVLDKARAKNPTNDELWSSLAHALVELAVGCMSVGDARRIAAIRLERRQDDEKAMAALLSRALQACPDSGRLWAEAVVVAPKSQQKQRINDALKKCSESPHVLFVTAKMFFQQGNWPKARSWLERTLKLKGGEDMGDVWAVLYKLESEHGLQRFGAMELYKEASFHSFLVPKLPITKSASQCRQVGANGQALLSIPVDDGTPQAAYEVMQRCKAADPHHGELWPQIVKDPAHWQWTTEQVLVYCAALFRLDQRSPLDALNPPPPGVPVVPPPPPKEATGADGLSAAGGATALTEEKKPKAEPGVVMSAAAPSSLSSSSSAVVAAASTPPRSPSSTAAQPKQEGGVAMAPPPTMGPPAARRSG